jgi:ZIP family zinc transporter
VALPVFAQTGSRVKAFLFGALSSLPLPMGAGIAWILLATTNNVKPSPLMHAVVFGFVGGMMLYVSFTELLPQSYKQNGPMAQAGVITGMLVIASSFVVFDLI